MGIEGDFLLDKKSNYLAFFPTQTETICYSHTFFLAFCPYYVHYFPGSVMLLIETVYCIFFQQRTYLIKEL